MPTHAPRLVLRGRSLVLTLASLAAAPGVAAAEEAATPPTPAPPSAEAAPVTPPPAEPGVPPAPASTAPISPRPAAEAPAQTPATPKAPAHPRLALEGGTVLTADGQVRPRVVAHTGRDFKKVRRAEQVYVTQRARLGVTLENPVGVAVVVRLQDVRAWGEEDAAAAPTLNDFDADGFDAHEAYLRVAIGDAATLQLGRQEIALDTQRLVGAVNWRQSGQSFDGGRLNLKLQGFDADAFLAVVQESSHQFNTDAHVPGGPGGARKDDVLFGGLHGHAQVAEMLDLSAAYYVRKFDTIEELRHTAGVVAQLAGGGFKGSLEAYYQFGDAKFDTDGDKVPDKEKSIGAWLAALRAGYDLGGDLAPSVMAFAEMLSGQKGKPEKSFDTQYGTNHMYYGELDYFLSFPKDTFGLGLMDLGARAGVKPLPKLATTLDFHLFRSMDETPVEKKNDLGMEIDVKADWKALDNLALGLLYGVFLPGEATRELRGIAKADGEDDMQFEQALYLTSDASF